MPTYRVAAAVSTALGLSIAWLWFGVFFGLGPDESKPVIYLWKRDLQDKTIILGIAVIFVAVTNVLYFALTGYRGLARQQPFNFQYVLQALFGLAAPMSLFFFALVGLYALAFAAENKLPPYVGSIIAVVAVVLIAATIVSILRGVLKKT